MGTKQTLFKAHKTKDDEYYTLYEDISSEVTQYKNQLKGKRIICPCDWDQSHDEILVYKSEYEVTGTDLFSEKGSIKEIDIKKTKECITLDLDLVKCNFVKFLIAHAEDYEIQSISVSGYDPKEPKGVRFQDIDYSKYDLVITNPPFSQFREFIDTMFKNNLKFLVICPITALTYKEVFQYIKNNQLWLGYASQLSGFRLADGTTIYSKDKEGSVPRACKWCTNLDVSYRHDKLILTEKYSPEKYPNYYNYDGIEVSETRKIPYDFNGSMGVPVTFLSKYNPEQFEIIDKGVQAEKTKRFKGDKATLWTEKDGKPDKAPFERILIRNKEVEKDED